MRSENTEEVIKNLYGTLVESDGSLNKGVNNENIELLLNLITTEASNKQLRSILEIKIKEDRMNLQSYLTPRDRSTVNKEIFLGHIKIRNIVLKALLTVISMIVVIGIIFFYIDLHHYLVKTGGVLIEYDKIFNDFIKHL